MEMFVAKLKSLKLELGEDLIVHLVLISLPTHLGQFKVSYNTQKENCNGSIVNIQDGPDCIKRKSKNT
ncbi:hypothetical protein CR513_54224, partial [Mucuna pruriens]